MPGVGIGFGSLAIDPGSLAIDPGFPGDPIPGDRAGDPAWGTSWDWIAAAAWTQQDFENFE